MKIFLFSLFVLLLSFNCSGQYIATVAGNGLFGTTGDSGLSTLANLSSPWNVDVDASGNFYIATSWRVRKVDIASGIITTVAGNGTAGFVGDGGLAINASIDNLIGLDVDNSGNIFIADNNNNCIRRVDAVTGIITRVAGTDTAGFNGDGILATTARLNHPQGVAVDAQGNIFISDQYNFRIRKVDVTTGLISTIAGNGMSGYTGDNGAATSATFYFPKGLTTDNFGNVYVADCNNHVIRKINLASGIITTIAGNGFGAGQVIGGDFGDGGLATLAELNFPTDVKLDIHGNIFIADAQNGKIKMVSSTNGLITTIAGGGSSGLGDGGLATDANLSYADGVAIDANGNLYIADYYHARIRKVDNITGVNEIFENSFSIFPNPSTGLLNFNCETNIDEIKVTNTLGQIVYSKTINHKSGTINLQSLPSGLYFCSVKTEDGKTAQQKFIVQH